MSARQSYGCALKAAGLLDSNSNDGAFSNIMHRFGERSLRLGHIDEQLGHDN
jgi:hypothetical protein